MQDFKYEAVTSSSETGNRAQAGEHEDWKLLVYEELYNKTNCYPMWQQQSDVTAHAQRTEDKAER